MEDIVFNHYKLAHRDREYSKDHLAVENLSLVPFARLVRERVEAVRSQS